MLRVQCCQAASRGPEDPGLLRLHCFPDGDIVILQHLMKQANSSEPVPWPARGKVQNECSIGLEVSTHCTTLQTRTRGETVLTKVRQIPSRLCALRCDAWRALGSTVGNVPGNQQRRNMYHKSGLYCLAHFDSTCTSSWDWPVDDCEMFFILIQILRKLSSGLPQLLC